MIDYQSIIDKYYESGSSLREILIRHSRQVANLAQRINEQKSLGIDPKEIEAAAMLHDIGIFLTNAPGIQCLGSAPYIAHGTLGAQLLRKEKAPEWAARVAERHTGSGLTAAEIKEQALPLPATDLLPETLLEKLICYADKFYSKSGDFKQKPIEKVIGSMQKHGEEAAHRFLELHSLFG